MERIVEHVVQVLEAFTSFRFFGEARANLRKALLPYMRTLQLLHHQEADYHLEMQPVYLENKTQLFNAETMEDMAYGEAEDGPIRASFFPAVYKYERVDNGTGVSAAGMSDIKLIILTTAKGKSTISTVVCKAKVVL